MHTIYELIISDGFINLSSDDQKVEMNKLYAVIMKMKKGFLIVRDGEFIVKVRENSRVKYLD